MKTALSFDDVLLVPKRTFGGSRDKVNLETYICGRRMPFPIFSANMSSVTEIEMALSMWTNGCLGVLHRMCSITEQVEMLKTLDIRISCGEYTSIPVYVSVEGTRAGIERIEKTNNFIPYGYCIDTAHADSPDVEDTIVEIRKEFPDLSLIIGNYATALGVVNLYSRLFKEFGPVNNIAFKVGIGSGSQCTTRIVTGCGLPTLESIFRIRKECPQVELIADGGIKNSGDIVKCLAAGANAVMIGHLFAGTAESPGNVIRNGGSLYKVYRGSASFGQKFEVGKNGYVEGEETLVPYRSHVATVLKQLIEGVKSGFSYCGALNIKELQENAEFVSITNSGYVEGTPHGA